MRYTIVFLILISMGCSRAQHSYDHPIFKKEKDRVLELVADYENLEPITVTAAVCERSTGGRNDFYSEGDYWWPDPENPDGPYIRKDGMTNPENFTAHRTAMIRFSQIAGALGSAYLITKDAKYAEQLRPHVLAWFFDENTRMNPNLLYGQAIMGKVTGRGIGIIDTIHLMEVAKAFGATESSGVFSKDEIKGVKEWFTNYLNWITTHEYGVAERDNGNNHSVCWALQVAVFAELVKDQPALEYVREMYKNVLLPRQMAANGSFPLELERTKPYGYSLFNIDALTGVCQVASTPENNLFAYTTDDGRGIAKGIEFIFPYTKDKSKWPYAKDVMYWDEWPVRHPYLLFGGLAFEKESYLALWNTLEPNFDTPEVVRNMPIRYPLLWLN
ncbi:alginate lyase family protein [Aggregatimonas sangjinii]|uniref:Alginate lyase family protein n=1 Tax=Aggregatimonas sangjinii TaxID=2583587 RepID=A0A5B7SXZ1_9FLAO|nr:alginate lyase family protein [Aggregatimonas sangjinii]QCX01958.1 alginate lyase family protein [Aggregatimonas sangjinii]